MNRDTFYIKTMADQIMKDISSILHMVGGCRCVHMFFSTLIEFKIIVFTLTYFILSHCEPQWKH